MVYVKLASCGGGMVRMPVLGLLHTVVLIVRVNEVVFSPPQ